MHKQINDGFTRKRMDKTVESGFKRFSFYLIKCFYFICFLSFARHYVALREAREGTNLLFFYLSLNCTDRLIEQARMLATFRSDYEYEIEYEYYFSIPGRGLSRL